MQAHLRAAGKVLGQHLPCRRALAPLRPAQWLILRPSAVALRTAGERRRWPLSDGVRPPQKVPSPFTAAPCSTPHRGLHRPAAQQRRLRQLGFDARTAGRGECASRGARAGKSGISHRCVRERCAQHAPCTLLGTVDRHTDMRIVWKLTGGQGERAQALYQQLQVRRTAASLPPSSPATTCAPIERSMRITVINLRDSRTP
jgi:hypothetical protein